MEQINIGSWVRLLDGPHKGRRGIVLEERGSTMTVQVEFLINGELPIIAIPAAKLRPAGKQSARSFERWRTARNCPPSLKSMSGG
jgi:hypothetical protein